MEGANQIGGSGMKRMAGRAVAFAAAAALVLGGLAGCGGDEQIDGGQASAAARTSAGATALSPSEAARAAAQAEAAPKPVAGSAATARLLRGIPQRGIELGARDAPVTVVIFGDVQCPYCKAFSLRVLPRVIDRYVRPGRAKLVFRSLTFLGTDSVRGAQFAGAAGLQNRMWEVLDLLYRHQGAENSGWLTDQLLRMIGAGIPGLDTERALQDRGLRQVQRQLAEAKEIAADYRVTGTPSLLVGLSGDFVFPVPDTSLAGLTRAIEAALSDLSAG